MLPLDHVANDLRLLKNHLRMENRGQSCGAAEEIPGTYASCKLSHWRSQLRLRLQRLWSREEINAESVRGGQICDYWCDEL